MEKIHILDETNLMGKEMFELLIFTEEGQTIDELVNHSYYAQFIPYKHKVGKTEVKGEVHEYISFWVDESKKEELEDLNLLSLGQHNKKWN